jgi:hypothetical protein
MTEPSNRPITADDHPMGRIRAQRESIHEKSVQVAARKVDHNGRPIAVPAEAEQETAETGRPRFQGDADQGSANRQRVHVPSGIDAEIRAAQERGDWAASRRLKTQKWLTPEGTNR